MSQKSIRFCHPYLQVMMLPLSQRRPTTSARRQREVAAVVEDAPHVDDAAEEVFQHAEEAVNDVEGFPGGPCDTSVLTTYADRAAIIIWNEDERPELKLSSHGRKVQKFGRPVAEIEGLVSTTGLRSLVACSLDTGDRGLIFAFVESWHKKTSSFHLLVGEVTITLDDVASLLHLSIIGAFHSFNNLHVDEAVLLLVELLKVTGDEARAEAVQCHGAYSATHVHVVFLDAFRDLSQNGSYAWGDAALMHIVWIYENFPSIPEAFTKSDYDEKSPRVCRWTSTKASTKALLASTYHKRLDRLKTADVCWMPYERMVRQFGYVQMIPPHCAGLRLCFKDIDDRWIHFSDYLAPVGPICVVPRQCAHDYMEWFYIISHPFMRPSDPPRHSSVMQDGTYMEPDMSEIAVAATSMEEAPAQAPSNVEQPRHAMEDCQAIAERLERLLNLRIMTEGTEAHDVMQDCIRIARGVTVDGNVYVRSR
ncbi:Protein MAIN-LIKE 1 [Glycine soja]